MSLNLGITNIIKRAHLGQRGGLQPEELMEAGILSNPETPMGAAKRARGLIDQGAYRAARDLLVPHAHTADTTQRTRIAELLGTCALRCGGEWEDLLGTALCNYSNSNDKSSSARVYGLLGEGQLQAGKLAEAEKNLRRATVLFAEVGDTAQGAVAQSMRARVRMRSGALKSAIRLVDSALDALKPLGSSREEGVVRLVRARILAVMGAGEACAKELMFAERLLACSGSTTDRLLAPMVRAEALIALGEGRKAYAGLRRLLLDVVELENVHTRGWVHLMLGQAAMSESLPEARRHLMRAKHLFAGIRSELGVADCDLRLAQVEQRLGFAVASRLHGLGYLPVNQWRLFGAELKVARAECIAENNPDLARRLLFEARSFGLESGNRTLVRSADGALRNRQLVAHDEQLSPMEDEKTVPNVHGGVTTSPGFVPPGGLQSFDEDTYVSVRADRSDTSDAARRRRCERLAGRHGATTPGFGLTPPRGGVRVA